MSEPEPVITSDTPFAAFLKYHNHILIGLKPEEDDPKRVQFVFIRMDTTDELTTEFYMGKPNVHPKRFYHAIDSVFHELKKYLRSRDG